VEDLGSHGKSRRNRIIEKAGLHDVLLRDTRFQAPVTEIKKAILKALGLIDDRLYGPQSFDAIMLPAGSPVITEANVHEYLSCITLVEMKTTKKPIQGPSLAGFFFGATQREYDLAQKLGSKFLFAFVVLNSSNVFGKPFATLLSLNELEVRTRSKRIQYQVNLWGVREAKDSDNQIVIS